MTDEGQAVDVICLVFAKTVDSVNHRFLLVKMKSIGLGDVVVVVVVVRHSARLIGKVVRFQHRRTH